MPGCQQMLLNVSAFLTPFHFATGCGRFQRSSPTGGAAYGMPRNTVTSLDAEGTPCSSPPSTFTVGLCPHARTAVRLVANNANSFLVIISNAERLSAAVALRVFSSILSMQRYAILVNYARKLTKIHVLSFSLVRSASDHPPDLRHCFRPFLALSHFCPHCRKHPIIFWQKS